MAEESSGGDNAVSRRNFLEGLGFATGGLVVGTVMGGLDPVVR